MRIHEDQAEGGEATDTTVLRATAPAPIVDTSNTHRPRMVKPPAPELPPKPKAPPPPPPPPQRRTPSAHFLSEINVYDCFDFRAIPDPPSPETLPNKRRTSTSMLSGRDAVMPSVPPMPPSVGKRSRKSLCHVPSPLLGPSEADAETAQEAPSPPPPVSLQIQICLADEEEENNDLEHCASVSQSKRRKKRTSMELPRQLVEDHVKSDTREASTTFTSSRSFQGSHQEMEDLRALVRGFCRQSKEDRPTCVQAQAIQSLTGYPLVRSLDAQRSDRRMVLQLLAPVIEEMDQRKAFETEKWQDATGCRVERSRSGKYRYVSIETNQRVKSQEYQRRYRQVLEDEAELRLERANTWKAKLVLVDNESNGSSCDEDMSCQAGDQPCILEVESQPRGESIVGTSNAETSMDLCDMSVSMDLELSQMMGSEVEATMHDFPIATCSTSASDGVEEDTNDLEEEPSLQPIQTAPADVCELRPKSVTPTEYMGTLPLPDRDVESSDPEIAKVERRLWNRIDAALQDYSYQVMTIVNSRRHAANGPSQGAHGDIHEEEGLTTLSDLP